jgi:hypothetical protein
MEVNIPKNPEFLKQLGGCLLSSFRSGNINSIISSIPNIERKTEKNVHVKSILFLLEQSNSAINDEWINKMKNHLFRADHSDLSKEVETISLGFCNILEDKIKGKKFEISSKIIFSDSPKQAETTKYLIRNLVSDHDNIQNFNIPFDIGLKLLSDDIDNSTEDETNSLLNRSSLLQEQISLDLTNFSNK